MNKFSFGQINLQTVTYHSLGQLLQHAEPLACSHFEAFQSLLLTLQDHHRVVVLAWLAIHVAFAPDAFDPFPVQAPIFVYTISDGALSQLNNGYTRKWINMKNDICP